MPAVKKRPIGIDLFAGAGGLSLGFEQAGFDIVAAVEVDPIHAATHKFNFPECAVLARSVVGLSGAEIRRVAGIGKRAVDVVFGGAPCQGFSLIGQRALDDPRNTLVAEFVRIVSELRANYFVFENVKGLTVGRHKAFLDEVIAAFEAIGYDVVKPWRVLNAAEYGTPQDRERLILIGARRGLKKPSYPVATHRPPADKSLGLLTPGPTCLDALKDLPEAEEFDELITADEVTIRKWRKPSAYAAELRCAKPAHWHFGHKRIWNPLCLTSSTRTTHTEISRNRFAETDPGTVEPISRFFKLSPDGISNTLRAGTDAARGAFTSPRPIHYAAARCITVREMARLHGFPDWFRFHATKWHGARQVGNAVPPPLARAVAAAVRSVIATSASRPKKAIALGDPKLLSFEMSEAAAYWKVPRLVGKRDKKSGAKKRKQADIEAQRKRTVAPQPTNRSARGPRLRTDTGNRRAA